MVLASPRLIIPTIFLALLLHWSNRQEESDGALWTAVPDDRLFYFLDWSDCPDGSSSEDCGVIDKPSASGVWRQPSFRIARRLVRPRTLRHIAVAAEAAAGSFTSDIDSIDGRASFELYIIKRGATMHRQLARVVQPAIDLIVPLVKRAMQCDTCELRDVLIRRYLPSERSQVPQHYDFAFATAVLTLNASDFQGGYYVVGAEPLHLLCDSGDVIVHGYNLQHGVEVTRGSRYALLAWFTPRPGLKFSDESPWLQDLARDGDEEALRQLRARGESLF